MLFYLLGHQRACPSLSSTNIYSVLPTSTVVHQCVMRSVSSLARPSGSMSPEQDDGSIAPDLDLCEKQHAEQRELDYADRRQIHYADNSREPCDTCYGISRVDKIRGSMSFDPVQNAVDPALVLPVAYRTISINIGEKEHAKVEKVKGISNDKIVSDLGSVDYHLVSIDELYKRFAVSPIHGLSSDAVSAKITQFGRNIPSPPKSNILHKILVEYMFGGFGTILFVGAILVLISWKPLGEPNPAAANLGLAIVLILVWVIQATFNAWQDFSSSRVMKSITGMLPEDCYLLRDGSKTKIATANVVPGDILYFRAGNKLPADIRFLEVSADAKFDRSILTGESLPVSASLECSEANYLETRCIGMQGTYCTSGSGTGIVVSTGDNTIFGHIATVSTAPSTEMTPLQKEVNRFVVIIASIMLFFDLIFIGVYLGYTRKKHPDFLTTEGFIVSLVSVAIAFIPEGLPISVTASLTITANIMKRNNILCKSLRTVETLGAVSVLLSDKTGTLTKNEMVVTDVVVGVLPLSADDAVKEVAGELNRRRALEQVQIIASVCNVSEFDPSTICLPLAQRKIIADATDCAVFRFAASLSPPEVSREMWSKVSDVAFNSRNKFAIRVSKPVSQDSINATFSSTEASSFSLTNDLFLAIKGAPDVLMPRCNVYVCENGALSELDRKTRTAIEHIKDTWSAQGKRVILLARKIIRQQDIHARSIESKYEDELMRLATSGLVLCGLVGIVDPCRPEVPSVVHKLRGAGVRVMMVTGDFKLTAQCIAVDCGIISCHLGLVDNVDALLRDGKRTNGGQALVISGPDIITLSDGQWDSLCDYQEVVFARTSPSQKLRIVKEFKKRGNIVAMTGDGVNDAPSLKEADIGIALATGSDIAIEAADMVLLDSFSAIVEALKYGRVVFDNLKKVCCYLLPAGTFSEFWPVWTNVVFGMPQILSSFLMIVICCLTDCGTAIAMAYEQPESNVLLRPPRNVKTDKLVNLPLMLHAYGLLGVIETICSFSMAYWYLKSRGFGFSYLWWTFGDYSAAPQEIQNEASLLLNKASAIYFVTLVVMQWFNAMATRTRYLSIFQHPPLFNSFSQNWRIFTAIVFSIAMIFIFCYIPGIRSVAGSGSIPTAHWFIPAVFGVTILCLDELRKAGVRRWPRSLLAKVAW
ncbi:uncharacterized protein V1518DRAFT_422042 [Limtongia smithiae]|uniref:uncharacterized protein n=1 Tax=Limtongia smithiae TaxID=1125753 RepID=UPI0034CD9F04